MSFIPGMTGAVAGLAASGRRTGPLTSLAALTPVLSTTTSITIPADALPGDLAVLIMFAKHDGGTVTPTTTVPTDFISLANTVLTGTPDSRCITCYKVLTAGDPGASLTVMAGATSQSSILFVFQGDGDIVTATPQDPWNSQGTSSNPSSQSVTGSGQSTPLVIIGSAAAAGNAEFSTASPAFDAEVETSDGFLNAGYKIYNSSPANHTIDMNDITSNHLHSGRIICAGA